MLEAIDVERSANAMLSPSSNARCRCSTVVVMNARRLRAPVVNGEILLDNWLCQYCVIGGTQHAVSSSGRIGFTVKIVGTAISASQAPVLRITEHQRHLHDDERTSRPTDISEVPAQFETGDQFRLEARQHDVNAERRLYVLKGRSKPKSVGSNARIQLDSRSVAQHDSVVTTLIRFCFFLIGCQQSKYAESS